MDDEIKKYTILAEEHYSKGEYDLAYNYLISVTKNNDSYPDAFNMLGVIYHSKRKFTKAQECFKKAFEINPNYTEAALNLVITYNDLGNYVEAKNIYQQALKLSSNDTKSPDRHVKAKLSNMYAEIADIYINHELFSNALVEYDKALELCPSFKDIRMKKAKCLSHLGKYIDAKNEYYLILENNLNDDSESAYINLGMLHYKKGWYRDAISVWKKLLAIKPECERAKTYISMVEDELSGAKAIAFDKIGFQLENEITQEN